MQKGMIGTRRLLKKKALVHSKAQRGVMIEKLIAFKQGRFYSSF
jgi:hypothetical protein